MKNNVFTPYIICDEKMWKYIRNYLINWKYNIENVDLEIKYNYDPDYNFKFYLTIDDLVGKINECNAYYLTNKNMHLPNRKLINNVEEFLQICAKLHNYKYKRKDIIYKNQIKGEIENFPKEILQKMIIEQNLQGNKINIKIFQKNKTSTYINGGFDWNNTIDGEKFWHEVIYNENFKDILHQEN